MEARVRGAAHATSKFIGILMCLIIILIGFHRLTFTSTSIAGKKMIVQATNTGADLAQGQFDLAIPGGGVGICTLQFQDLICAMYQTD